MSSVVAINSTKKPVVTQPSSASVEKPIRSGCKFWLLSRHLLAIVHSEIKCCGCKVIRQLRGCAVCCLKDSKWCKKYDVGLHMNFVAIFTTLSSSLLLPIFILQFSDFSLWKLMQFGAVVHHFCIYDNWIFSCTCCIKFNAKSNHISLGGLRTTWRIIYS
jgi:hypothetical protein